MDNNHSLRGFFWMPATAYRHEFKSKWNTRIKPVSRAYVNMSKNICKIYGRGSDHKVENRLNIYHIQQHYNNKQVLDFIETVSEKCDEIFVAIAYSIAWDCILLQAFSLFWPSTVGGLQIGKISIQPWTLSQKRLASNNLFSDV